MSRARPTLPAPDKTTRWRFDWRKNANGLIALGLAGLLAAVSTTAPRWSRFLRQPLQGAPEDAGAEEPGGAPTPTPPAGAVPHGTNRHTMSER